MNSDLAGQTIYCPMCGNQMMIPPPSGHAPLMASNADEPSQNVQYAGFWIRWVASIIDTMVLIIPMVIAGSIIPVLGGMMVFIIYKGLCLGNWNGQTIGKRACGIRVVDLNLQPCSLGQAFGRSFAEILSTIILLLGYILAAFDGRKQALHDKMADTLHIYVK